MGYSNYEELKQPYCGRTGCRLKDCKYNQFNLPRSQSGIEYTVLYPPKLECKLKK